MIEDLEIERTAYMPFHYIGESALSVEDLFWVVYTTDDEQLCIDSLNMLNSTLYVNAFLKNIMNNSD